ncbi:MAG: pyruvate dehydrogenase (acetyl-transferring) E1 component subunit alpha [marine bacterium B5-7]|nr:MAG: pyruvate dehydrogenase (acetyl-transferring) E1 component subunit alpha [marine bacterium B5-7]
MDVVAEFNITYDSCLDQNGQLSAEPPTVASDKTLCEKLYQYMQLSRTLDTKVVNLQRTGKMGTYAAATGQEAVAASIGAAMQADDVLVSVYRENAALLQRGVTIQEILAYWGGDERGNDWSSREDWPFCVPLSTQMLHASGIAKAFQYRKQARVVVAVIGDGASSKGDFYEAINVAGAWKLPLVVVVNNNQWAISVPRHKQTSAETLAQKGIAAGLPSRQVDGNDALMMYDALHHAIENARNGGGPALIEAMTYRLCDHTTADDATRYREKTDTDTAWEAEPIKRFNKFLTQQHGWSEMQEETLKTKCAANVDQAVQDYLKQDKQAPGTMFDFLFAQLPDSLQAQRDEVIKLAGGSN